MIFLFTGKRRHKIKQGGKRETVGYINYMYARPLFVEFEIMLDEIGKL